MCCSIPMCVKPPPLRFYPGERAQPRGSAPAAHRHRHHASGQPHIPQECQRPPPPTHLVVHWQLIPVPPQLVTSQPPPKDASHIQFILNISLRCTPPTLQLLTPDSPPLAHELFPSFVKTLSVKDSLKFSVHQGDCLQTHRGEKLTMKLIAFYIHGGELVKQMLGVL
jgi:hypothetical protein